MGKFHEKVITRARGMCHSSGEMVSAMLGMGCCLELMRFSRDSKVKLGQRGACSAVHLYFADMMPVVSRYCDPLPKCARDFSSPSLLVFRFFTRPERGLFYYIVASSDAPFIFIHQPYTAFRRRLGAVYKNQLFFR